MGTLVKQKIGMLWEWQIKNMISEVRDESIKMRA